MIKKLDFLESEIPNSLYLEAEQILEHGSIELRPSQIRHLKLYTVSKGEEIFEVEILTSPKYVKSYSCDCQQLNKNGICGHISAGLIILRKTRIADALARAKRKQPEKKKNTNLSTDAIFDQIDSSELRAFIKQYASKNKKFDLEFKVNFARRVKLDNTYSKYEKLVERVLPPITAAGKSYTAPSINLFVKHGKELFEQYKDAKTLESYTEASTILLLLLKKAAYAIKHCKIVPDSLEYFSEKLHTHIFELYKENLAPELKDKLSMKLVELIQLSYYQFPSFENNLVLPILMYGDKNEQKALFEALSYKIEDINDKRKFSEIVCYIILLSDKLKLSYLFLYKEIKTHHLHDIFNLLLLRNHIGLMEKFSVESQKREKYNDFPFVDIDILLSKRNHNMDTLMQALTKKYLARREGHIFEELIQFEPEESRIYLEKIVRELRNNQQYSKNILSIYMHLEEYELLIDYTLEFGLYSHITPYFNTIIESKEELAEYYYRKYTKKCDDDPFHAHRNQIYIRRNFDSIRDPKLSNHFLNRLDMYKTELEEIDQD